MNRLPKHVTLKHLNAFVAVAQESSFTRAAERLFQTQSSVTSLVRQLEEALSTLLFARTSRRVLLTAAGEEFLPRVMRLLADFDGAIGDVVRFGALERGRVGVAAAPSAITQIIAPAAAAFAARHPAVRLYLSDDNSGRIQRKVAAREVDFGLTSRWADAPGLDFEPLLEDRFGVLYREDDAGLRRAGTARCAGRTWPAANWWAWWTRPASSRCCAPAPTCRSRPPRPSMRRPAPPRRRRWSRRDWAWRCCRRWPPSACASRDWPTRCWPGPPWCARSA